MINAEFNPTILRRILFFASAHPPVLTEKCRFVLGKALSHEDSLVITYASELAYRVDDTAVDRMVLSAARNRKTGVDHSDEAFWRDRAVANAVISLKSYENIDLVSPRFIGIVAEKLGEVLDNEVVEEIQRTISRLLSPVISSPPEQCHLFLEVDQSYRDPIRRYEESQSNQDDIDVEEKMQTWAAESRGSREGIDAYSERQKSIYESVRRYIKNLEMEGAQALVNEPDVAALKSLVARDYPKIAKLADRILCERDQNRLSTVRNFALALAEAISSIDTKRCAALLKHVNEADCVVTILVGDARIPQGIRALFAGSDSEKLDLLRKNALDRAETDADIESLVFAAQAAGKSDWLHRWIHSEVSSDVPGRIARGLMAEGLRNGDLATSEILDQDWGGGFLGVAAESARFAYERNYWSKTWAKQVIESSGPVDFWRFSELLIGIVDVRAFHWLEADYTIPMIRRFGPNMFKRIRSATEKRTKNRRETLFGQKKPDSSLSRLLNSH